MHRFALPIVIGLLASFAITSFNAADAASLMKTQAPCVGTNGFCTAFTATQPIPVIRSFSFVAPSEGTATVLFHGMMGCANQSATEKAIIDIESQIVAVQSLVADQNGPGGLQHTQLLLPVPGSGNFVSFNLASTRLFTIKAAGTQNYHFKMHKTAMGANTFCLIRNAVFTVNFVP